jgi:hypothetical protein
VNTYLILAITKSGIAILNSLPLFINQPIEFIVGGIDNGFKNTYFNVVHFQICFVGTKLQCNTCFLKESMFYKVIY